MTILDVEIVAGTLLAAACTVIVWLAVLLVLSRRRLSALTDDYDKVWTEHARAVTGHAAAQRRLDAERGIKEHMVWRAKVYAAALDRCEYLLHPQNETLARLGRDARHFIGIAHHTSTGPLPATTDGVLDAWAADPWADLTKPPPGPPNPPRPPHHRPVA